ncbi:shikimate dehydrogenase [Williamsia phyllosphaerae]|uniref:shikimate dehydrogenase (NADP(+)) n=1 Tax=Williamsia phyllosphaerae TaxID=885042 RepID=A0ABQ1V953_9NOCA|nr:shikimate dehydrogenase [Williamsia phyllosphaerae]GGF41422.1 putative shikimate-5-dehydrogenase (AroE) [Williamsia phyllosphaerae]
MSLTADPRSAQIRRAAVLGSPIGHSRSPDLHLAAYRALGLEHWTYERIECTAETLPALVDGLDESYIGLSVTMPAKVAALRHATTVTDRARLVGSANTLVRTDSGRWHADCTDIDGVTGALAELDADDLAGESVVLIGAGGTARPALAALASAGAGAVTVVVRDASRADGLRRLAAELRIDLDTRAFESSADLTAVCARSSVVVSTVPAEAAGRLAASIAAAPRLLDAIYHPWPTPAAAAVADAGGRVIGGLVMLLNQAVTQVESFTGLSAPRAQMAAALAD